MNFSLLSTHRRLLLPSESAIQSKYPRPGHTRSWDEARVASTVLVRPPTTAPFTIPHPSHGTALSPVAPPPPDPPCWAAGRPAALAFPAAWPLDTPRSISPAGPPLVTAARHRRAPATRRRLPVVAVDAAAATEGDTRRGEGRPADHGGEQQARERHPPSVGTPASGAEQGKERAKRKGAAVGGGCRRRCRLATRLLRGGHRR